VIHSPLPKQPRCARAVCSHLDVALPVDRILRMRRITEWAACTVARRRLPQARAQPRAESVSMPATASQSAKSRELDNALQDTFPASDPPSMTTPIAATPSEQYVRPDTGGEVRLYRVIEAHDAAQPFAPDAGGGRWTHPGNSCVYASLSPAAALLEYLVHLEGRTPDRLLLATAAIPAAQVLVESNLPSTWCTLPYHEEVRQVGDGWLRSGRSLALQVPSAVCMCMDEGNVLLNPDHPAFAALQLVALRPLNIDPRLRI
jgi:RES domain-containing protein